MIERKHREAQSRREDPVEQTDINRTRARQTHAVSDGDTRTDATSTGIKPIHWHTVTSPDSEHGAKQNVWMVQWLECLLSSRCGSAVVRVLAV